jgi:hypothetical protein
MKGEFEDRHVKVKRCAALQHRIQSWRRGFVVMTIMPGKDMFQAGVACPSTMMCSNDAMLDYRLVLQPHWYLGCTFIKVVNTCYGEEPRSHVLTPSRSTQPVGERVVF